ncbi:MAG: oxygen-dependent coproporphyrinogen oxidase [Bacteroidia bacterium]
MITKDIISSFFKTLQNDICSALEKADEKNNFSEEIWQREGGGGGCSRVIQDGKVIEKGGVNFSAVHGKLPENIQHALKLKAPGFYATGISIIIHPQNPMVPIIHANLRYFETDEGKNWFGGGIDLTPHYIVKEDARFFHQQLKKVCDEHDTSYYPKFKKEADDYFFIPHRNETRGIGGIFFDHLVETENTSQKDIFEFVKAIGNSFIPIYGHLIEKNKNIPFTEKQKQWQLLRRGRYVEFNLVYDKGTKFGLDTAGRIESILVSLPKNASWLYNFIPEKNSPEEKTLDLLKKGLNWAT